MEPEPVEPISDQQAIFERVARRRRVLLVQRRMLQALAGAAAVVVVAGGAMALTNPEGDQQNHLTGPPGAGCRNSFDPSCGPFHWDPEPEPHQPLIVRVEISEGQPVAGEPVTFEVHATDDAVSEPRATSYGFGDDFGLILSNWSCDAPPKRYGPWTPPEPRLETIVRTFTHTYQEPGTYEAIFTFTTEKDCRMLGHDPYGGEATASVTVTVV